MAKSQLLQASSAADVSRNLDSVEADPIEVGVEVGTDDMNCFNDEIEIAVPQEVIT